LLLLLLRVLGPLARGRNNNNNNIQLGCAAFLRDPVSWLLVGDYSENPHRLEAQLTLVQHRIPRVLAF